MGRAHSVLPMKQWCLWLQRQLLAPKLQRQSRAYSRKRMFEAAVTEVFEPSVPGLLPGPKLGLQVQVRVEGLTRWVCRDRCASGNHARSAASHEASLHVQWTWITLQAAGKGSVMCTTSDRPNEALQEQVTSPSCCLSCGGAQCSGTASATAFDAVRLRQHTCPGLARRPLCESQS